MKTKPFFSVFVIVRIRVVTVIIIISSIAFANLSKPYVIVVFWGRGVRFIVFDFYSTRIH